MLDIFSITDVGKRRKQNQDYIFTSKIRVGALPNLFIVADGMGGHKAGGYASKHTVEYVVESISNSINENQPIEVINSAIDYANSYIYDMSMEDKNLEGMGTTIVVATCEDDKLYVANVGDSRLYIANRNGIRQVTKDHSLVEEMVRRGGLNRDAARSHPDKNIITRAVGAMEYVSADFFEEVIDVQDLILMCTDGLTNMLDDNAISAILSRDISLREMGMALIKAANDNGGRDNIALILIKSLSDEVNR